MAMNVVRTTSMSRKNHVDDFRGRGFSADLQRSSPVAPQHQIAGANVPRRPFTEVFLPPLQPFEHDRVVEGTNEGISDGHILGVAQINAIGVVAPEADQLDTGNRHVPAAGGGEAPSVRVAQDHAVNLDVRTVGQPDRSATLAARKLAGVNDAAPEDAHPGQAAPPEKPEE